MEDQAGPRHNPGGRLLDLARRVQATAAGSALAGWSKVLRLPSGESANEREIAAALVAAHEQLDLVEHALSLSGFRPSTHKAAVEKMRQALSPRLLAGHWKYVKPHVAEPVPSILSAAADLMDEEPGSLGPDEIDQLRNAVRKVRELIEAGALPVALRQILLRHLAAIETALVEYPIRGSAAFARAAAEVASELSKDDAATIQEFQHLPEVRALAWLWSRIGVLTTRALLAWIALGPALSPANEFFDLYERVVPLIATEAARPIDGPRLLSEGGGDSNAPDGVGTGEEEESETTERPPEEA